MMSFVFDCLFYILDIWALDVIVDFSLDHSLTVVLQTILQYLQKCHHTTQFSALSSVQSQHTSQHSSERQHCMVDSFPTMIRVVVSDGFPLFETKAENIAFSSEPLADYYVSVQADMSKCVCG